MEILAGGARAFMLENMQGLGVTGHVQRVRDKDIKLKVRGTDEQHQQVEAFLNDLVQEEKGYISDWSCISRTRNHGGSNLFQIIPTATRYATAGVNSAEKHNYSGSRGVLSSHRSGTS
jgi:acylphosphatase